MFYKVTSKRPQERLQFPLSCFSWESCDHRYVKEHELACWRTDTLIHGSVSPIPQATASHLPDITVRPSTANWPQTSMNLAKSSRRTTQLISAHIPNLYNYALINGCCFKPQSFGWLGTYKSLSTMSIVTFYLDKEFKNNIIWTRNSVFDIVCLKYQWDCQGANWLNSSGTQERGFAWKHKSERQACHWFPRVGRLPWGSKSRVK